MPVRLFARFLGWFRRKPQEPALDEHAAYARCHGERNGEVVNVIVVPRTPRQLPRLTGSYLRSCFEKRLEDRRAAHT